jgi:pimeloyl-ACP methyl ester carboxylesterase
VRLYLAHFYDHCCGRKEAIRKREFDAIVDAYARPGAVKASIAYYRARAAERQAQPAGASIGYRIKQPTVIAWGDSDPVIPAAWADRLRDTFPDHQQTIETIRRALELAGLPNRDASGSGPQITREEP